MASDRPGDSAELKVKWRETFDTVAALLVAHLLKTLGFRGGRHILRIYTHKQERRDGKTPLAR